MGVKTMRLTIAVLAAGHAGWAAGCLARHAGKTYTEALVFGVGVAASALLLYFQAQGSY